MVLMQRAITKIFRGLKKIIESLKKKKGKRGHESKTSPS